MTEATLIQRFSGDIPDTTHITVQPRGRTQNFIPKRPMTRMETQRGGAIIAANRHFGPLAARITKQVLR